MSNRREFITLLSGAVATWSFAARAQQMGKLPTIGFLGARRATEQRDEVAVIADRVRA
jgi:hypothetical protein